MSRNLASIERHGVRRRVGRRQTIAQRSQPITQDKLKQLHALQEEYEEAQRVYAAVAEKYKKLRDELALRSVQGAEIRTGLYKPNFKLIKIRHPRYKDALINAKGEHYQQEVLDKTKPTIHYYGQVD